MWLNSEMFKWSSAAVMNEIQACVCVGVCVGVCWCECVFLYLQSDDTKQGEAGVLNKVSTEDQHTAACRQTDVTLMFLIMTFPSYVCYYIFTWSLNYHCVSHKHFGLGNNILTFRTNFTFFTDSHGNELRKAKFSGV